MAKNSMFWGNASGKLGEAVLYRANGQERSRAYVPNPKNPKTRRQAKQRLGFASLTQVYNMTSEVVKFGFPDKKKNQSGFNAFIAANTPALAGLIPSSAMSNRLCFPFGVRFTRGDLLPVQCAWNKTYFSVRDVDGETLDSTVFNGLQFKLVKPSGSYDEQPTGTDPDKSWLPALGEIKLAKSLYNLLVSGGNLMDLPALVKATLIRFSYNEEGQGWSARVFSENISADSTADISKWKLVYLASKEDASHNITVDALGSSLEGSLTSGICLFILSYTDAATNKLHVTKSYISQEPSAPVNSYNPGGDVYNALIDSYVTKNQNSLATPKK